MINCTLAYIVLYEFSLSLHLNLMLTSRRYVTQVVDDRYSIRYYTDILGHYLGKLSSFVELDNSEVAVISGKSKLPLGHVGGL